LEEFHLVEFDGGEPFAKRLIQDGLLEQGETVEEGGWLLVQLFPLNQG
jgi:hypothetical protein